MGRKYAIRDQCAVHFVTFTVVNWIDVFIRNDYKQILIDSLIYCQQNKGLRIHAYCIMTSHVHLILSVEEEYNLSDAIRDYKSYTATQLKKAISENKYESRREWMLWMFERAGKKNARNTDFQFWQQHNHPIELSSNEMIDQRLMYIHNNPVEAGFVVDSSEWIWSSSADYQREEKGKIDLYLLL